MSLAQSGHARRSRECPLSGVKRTLRTSSKMSANDPKRTLAVRQTTAPGRTSEIGNLQQPAVADPGSGQVSLGLVSGSGIAARLI